MLIAFLASFAAGMQAYGASYTATEVARKAAAAVGGSKSFTVSFKLTAEGHSVDGTLKTSGKKFSVTTAGECSWYNGKDLYTYNPRTKETTVVTPSAAELAEVNPLLYVNGSSNAYTASFSKKRAAGKYIVELTPKSRKSTVRKIVVTVSSSTFLPEKITVNTASGQTAEVAVISLKRNAVHAASEFEYPRSRYRGAEIIDLR